MVSKHDTLLQTLGLHQCALVCMCLHWCVMALPQIPLVWPRCALVLHWFAPACIALHCLALVLHCFALVCNGCIGFECVHWFHCVHFGHNTTRHPVFLPVWNGRKTTCPLSYLAPGLIRSWVCVGQNTMWYRLGAPPNHSVIHRGACFYVVLIRRPPTHW